MALPVVTAGVRLAMAIAKHAGKKLVKTGVKQVPKGMPSASKAKGVYKLKQASFGRISRKSLRPYSFKKHAVSSSKALASSIKSGVLAALPGAKRHLKFYKKVISPTGTQFKNLITRPTFGQRKLLTTRPGSKFAGEYITKTTKGMKLRAKLLGRGALGGYIGYRTFKD